MVTGGREGRGEAKGGRGEIPHTAEVRRVRNDGVEGNEKQVPHTFAKGANGFGMTAREGVRRLRERVAKAVIC